MHAVRPDLLPEFEAATPRGKKLPERVRPRKKADVEPRPDSKSASGPVPPDPTSVRAYTSVDGLGVDAPSLPGLDAFVSAFGKAAMPVAVPYGGLPALAPKPHAPLLMPGVGGQMGVPKAPGPATVGVPATPQAARGHSPRFNNPMPGAPNPLGAGTLAYGGARAPGMGDVKNAADGLSRNVGVGASSPPAVPELEATDPAPAAPGARPLAPRPIPNRGVFGGTPMRVVRGVQTQENGRFTAMGRQSKVAAAPFGTSPVPRGTPGIEAHSLSAMNSMGIPGASGLLQKGTYGGKAPQLPASRPPQAPASGGGAGGLPNPYTNMAYAHKALANIQSGRLSGVQRPEPARPAGYAPAPPGSPYAAPAPTSQGRLAQQAAGGNPYGFGGKAPAPQVAAKAPAPAGLASVPPSPASSPMIPAPAQGRLPSMPASFTQKPVLGRPNALDAAAASHPMPAGPMAFGAPAPAPAMPDSGATAFQPDAPGDAYKGMAAFAPQVPWNKGAGFSITNLFKTNPMPLIEAANTAVDTAGSFASNPDHPWHSAGRALATGVGTTAGIYGGQELAASPMGQQALGKYAPYGQLIGGVGGALVGGLTGNLAGNALLPESQPEDRDGDGLVGEHSPREHKLAGYLPTIELGNAALQAGDAPKGHRLRAAARGFATGAGADIGMTAGVLGGGGLGGLAGAGVGALAHLLLNRKGRLGNVPVENWAATGAMAGAIPGAIYGGSKGFMVGNRLADRLLERAGVPHHKSPAFKADHEDEEPAPQAPHHKSSAAPSPYTVRDPWADPNQTATLLRRLHRQYAYLGHAPKGQGEAKYTLDQAQRLLEEKGECCDCDEEGRGDVKQAADTLWAYRCPSCGGENCFNGLPDKGLHFRGGMKCADCGETASAIGRTPLRKDVPMAEPAPRPWSPPHDHEKEAGAGSFARELLGKVAPAARSAGRKLTGYRAPSLLHESNNGPFNGVLLHSGSLPSGVGAVAPAFEAAAGGKTLPHALTLAREPAIQASTGRSGYSTTLLHDVDHAKLTGSQLEQLRLLGGRTNRALEAEVAGPSPLRDLLAHRQQSAITSPTAERGLAEMDAAVGGLPGTTRWSRATPGQRTAVKAVAGGSAGVAAGGGYAALRRPSGSPYPAGPTPAAQVVQPPALEPRMFDGPADAFAGGPLESPAQEEAADPAAMTYPTPATPAAGTPAELHGWGEGGSAPEPTPPAPPARPVGPLKPSTGVTTGFGPPSPPSFLARNAVPLGLGAAGLGLGAYGLHSYLHRHDDDEEKDAAARPKPRVKAVAALGAPWKGPLPESARLDAGTRPRARWSPPRRDEAEHVVESTPSPGSPAPRPGPQALRARPKVASALAPIPGLPKPMGPAPLPKLASPPPAAPAPGGIARSLPPVAGGAPGCGGHFAATTFSDTPVMLGD